MSGVVQNTEKATLPAANVLAYQISDKDTILSKYTLANAEGTFQLNLTKGFAYFLKVKALGYADGILNIEKTDTLIKHIFILQSQAIQLREVIVKHPPVKANNDTTTFKVKAFADGTERNVEDLLRKLPGVRVDDNGKITVQGKMVDKVMIEGEDLFSKNYQIITRSLSPASLDKVEAIENYSENPLLKGIEKSNKTVLNLKVRPELKIRPFGNIGGDIGYKKRYYFNTTLLTLLGKLKGGIVANSNNIGQNPVASSEYALASEQDGQDFSTFQSNLLSAIPLTTVSVPNLEPRRVTFNTSKMIGLTATYNLTKKLKIKGFSYLYSDILRLGSGSRTQYFFNSTNVQFRDSSLQHRTPTLWTNQIKAEYNLNPKTNFKYTFTNRNSNIGSSLFLDTQNQQLSEKVTSNGQDNIGTTSHQLNTVRRINDRNAMIADISYTMADLSRLNTIRSQRYASFFKIDNKFQLSTQTIEQSQREWKTSLRWKNINKWGNLAVGLGYLYKADNTTTDLSIKADDNQLYRPLSGFQNEISYKNDLFLLDIQQTFQANIFRFNVGGVGQWTNAKMQNALQKNTNFTKSNWILQPTVGISAQISQNTRLIALYFNQQSLPPTEQFTTNYIQSSYRSFQANEGIFFISKNDFWQLSYNNTNWANLYAINAGISFSRTYFYNSFEFDFSNLLDFSTNRPIGVVLNQISGNCQIDRLISAISTKIRFEGNLGQSEILNRVNGSNLLPNNSQYLDAKLYLISVFKGFFNFQMSTRYRFNRFVQKNSAEINPKSVLFVPNLTLKINPIKSLFFIINAEQINWFTLNSHDNTKLLDFDVLYHAQNSQWSFSAKGNNLLNTNYIYYSNISNYSTSQNKYLLQPRWFTISASYNF